MFLHEQSARNRLEAAERSARSRLGVTLEFHPKPEERVAIFFAVGH